MANVFEHGETEGVRGLANRLELRYCENTGDRGYSDDLGDDRPPLGILQQTDLDNATGLIYGRYRDANVQVFNLDVASFLDDPGQPARSCVLVTFAADFPELDIGGHTRMSRLRLGTNRGWLRFAPDDFKQKFNVACADNETARTILDDGLIHWLLAGRTDVWIHLNGGALLVHTSRIDENSHDDWEALVDYAVGFNRQIPGEAWATYSAFGL